MRLRPHAISKYRKRNNMRRELVRKISEKFGLNIGNKEGNELKGFVPYPVIKVDGLDHKA